MKTLTLISCTLGIGMAVSACGTDPVVLGELIAAAERGSGDDAPVAPDTPAPVEEDPVAPDTSAPVEEDPVAADTPAPVEEDPVAADTPAPVGEDPVAEDPPPTSDTPVADPTPTSDEEAAVEQLLLQYCGQCHEAPADAGGLSVIGDVDELIALALIIPGSKEDSSVYARMVNGTMPPAGYADPPTSEDIEAIGSFIDDLE
jgi:hypothetical protein